MTTKTLGRDAILKKNDMAIRKLSVPAWGGSVYVRNMTGVDRDAWEKESSDRGDNVTQIMASLCAKSICDAKGELLFTAADIPALNQKSCAALSRVYEMALSLSKVTKEDIKELAKNSESAPKDAGGSE